MNVLFVGGTGQISLASVRESIAAGHKVSVFNRGNSPIEDLPGEVNRIVGDMSDPDSYGKLRKEHFDVVCQFKVYTPEQMKLDLQTFAGRVGQYIFISSASCYQKPAKQYLITEKTPLENPFWEYSKLKIASEQVLRDQEQLPYTIVRPSHTIRTHLPIQIGDWMVGLERILEGKPLLVTGDGTAPWTLTRPVDFSVPFVRLFGRSEAIGEDVHITGDRGFTWDDIHSAIARGFGTAAKNVHVPTETLIRYNRDWRGPLMGDKMYTALFDNSKIKAMVGDFKCSEDLDEILAEPVETAKEQLIKTAKGVAPSRAAAENSLTDKIVAEQTALGSDR
jgi:nucleoside-diphosphate-sugar epimerase